MDRNELIEIRHQLLKKELNEMDVHPHVIAVTKRVDVQDMEYALQAKLQDFGENRVDDLIDKAHHFKEKELEVDWHFIGHLQRNKVKKLLSVSGLKYIHSVDSKELLKELFEKCPELDEPILYFLQVNTSGEKEKHGFSDYDQLAEVINFIQSQEHKYLKFHGLMTMSKIRTNNFEEDAKACFELLKKHKKQLIRDFDLKEIKLSMGMSSDFSIACELGSDYIRVGSYFFKPEN